MRNALAKGAAAMLLCGAVSATPAAEQAPAAALDMQGTSIIGDRELPTVLYVVPWKDAAPAGAEQLPQEERRTALPAHLSRDQVRRQLRQRQAAGE